jgi:hypothetical protein
MLLRDPATTGHDADTIHPSKNATFKGHGIEPDSQKHALSCERFDPDLYHKIQVSIAVDIIQSRYCHYFLSSEDS